MSAGDFRATVLGVEYTDRDEYEKAARSLGYTRGQRGRSNRRASDWKPGTEVRVQLEAGGTARGQVWAKAEKGWVWLALDDRTFAKVNVSTLRVEVDGRQIGRVA